MEPNAFYGIESSVSAKQWQPVPVDVRMPALVEASRKTALRDRCGAPDVAGAKFLEGSLRLAQRMLENRALA